MGFSLSPAVTVKEFNLSQNVANLPSARTGHIIRADYGYCQTPVGVTTETELVSMFGKPTSSNYQDWFQAWNFLQYSSSLYLVRPIPKNALNHNYENAGIHIYNNVATADSRELYNKNKAEDTLSNISVNGKLAFYNKYIVPSQNLGIAVCSNSAYWNEPIADTYSAKIGSISVSGSSIPVTSNTLVKGNKFLSLGTGKLFNVLTSTPSNITVDYSFSTVAEMKKEFSLGHIEFISDSVSGSTFSVISTTTSNNAIVGQAYSFGMDLAYVTSIATVGSEETISFRSADGTAMDIEAGEGVVYSNAQANWMTLSSEYQTNAVSGIPAGSTQFNVQSGFNIPVGYVFTLDAAANNFTTSVDLYLESDSAYTVIAVDDVNNTIYLDSPLASDVKYFNSVAITSSLNYTDIDPITSSIKGINLIANKYDSSLIKKSRLTAKFAVDGDTATLKPYVKEDLVSFSDLFEFEPNWANGEFVTVVLKKNSSEIYENVEILLASYNENARNSDGRNIFANNIFFDTSNYLYAKVGTGKDVQVNSSLAAGLFEFESSTDTDYVFDDFNQSSIQFAYEEFADPESFDINILISHQLDMNYAATIAETRKDCVSIVATYDFSELITKSASEATKILLEKFGSRTVYDSKIFNTFGTYSAVYGNMKYQYDKYNDVNRWICVAGDVAGLYAQTDSNRDPWWAPAGSERGIIKNVIKLAFNPNKQNRDDLYVNAINPIISIVGEGAGVVYGQKTATAISSSFDRVNVRRLLIYLEKSIATYARTGLFEFNDAFTRQRLYSGIEPFLRTVKARRGLYEYLCIIDETNNTNEVIDSNALVIDIYLQPTKVAESINVNAILTKTGVSFSEVVGSF